jgi:Flp pilus assembly protein TadD
LILEALVQGALATTRLYRIKQLTDEWLKEPTRDPRPYYWRGFAHERFGGYQQDKAIADYKSAIERDEDFDEARERLANLLVNKNWANEARPHFEILLRRRPGDPKLLASMGRCLTAMGEIDAARQLLDRALTSFPDDPDLLRERGILALHDGKPEEAEPFLRRAVGSKTQDLAAGYNLYLCLQRLGRENEAKEQYQRHKELEAETNRLRQLMRDYQDRPRDADLLHEIGALYLSTGNSDFELTGLSWLRRALEVNPRHKKTCILLADFYQKKGMYELAGRLRKLAQD